MSSRASMASSSTPKVLISSLSSARPKPKPWGVWPTAESFRLRMAFLTRAASALAVTARMTLSSSGAPKA